MRHVRRQVHASMNRQRQTIKVSSPAPYFLLASRFVMTLQQLKIQASLSRGLCSAGERQCLKWRRPSQKWWHLWFLPFFHIKCKQCWRLPGPALAELEPCADHHQPCSSSFVTNAKHREQRDSAKRKNGRQRGGWSLTKPELQVWLWS